MKFNQTMAQRIRGMLLSIVQNESVFLCAAFFSYSFLSTPVLAWYAEQINGFNRFVILPWGGALCLLRLERAHANGAEFHADMGFLTLLFAWIVVPFGIRFGLTTMNVNDWFHCMVAFFGVYALITEETAQRRGMLMDAAGALFAVISFVMAALLLYCAYTAQTFGLEFTNMGFGLYVQDTYYLTAGFYYNSTGMFAVCCTLMCLLGAARRRSGLGKLAHLIPAAMMAVVVVLTQSRTARYSMLAAWAVGCYGMIACNTAIPRKALRHLAGIAAGAAVFVVGYMGAAMLTDSAVQHYQAVLSGQKEAAVVASAAAEEEQPSEPEKALQNEKKLGRGLGDMTFTDRTSIWKKVIDAWKEAPKNMIIGFGLGKINAITGGMTTHNAYLGFITNYGLIGFALLCCFFGSIAVPMCRAFFAPKGRAQAGSRVMAMVIVAALLTCMMESEPLGAMSPMNAVLMFSLAMLTADGRDLKTA